MRLIVATKWTLAMLLSIFVAGVIGTFFWTPVDPELSQRVDAEIAVFHREHAVATTQELDHFYEGLEAKYPESPSDTSFIAKVENAIVWRPWLAFLAVALCLITLRPALICSITSGVITSALTFGLLGMPPAVFVVGAVVIYLVTRPIWLRHGRSAPRS